MLAALPPGESKTEEFRGRAEQIRDETIYLKVKMEHHQRDVGAGTGLTVAEVADVRHRLPAGTVLTVRLEEPLVLAR